MAFSSFPLGSVPFWHQFNAAPLHERLFPAEAGSSCRNREYGLCVNPFLLNKSMKIWIC